MNAEFAAFFQREKTFALGVCNGCQMFSVLGRAGLIPGAEHWPLFAPNESGRFEARFTTVEIKSTDCIFFRGMQGSRIPVALAHAEGRASFRGSSTLEGLDAQRGIALKYTDHRFPLNPNGSTANVAGVTANKGRVLALMPHPERVVATQALSWVPSDMANRWNGRSPWFRMFENARTFIA